MNAFIVRYPIAETGGPDPPWLPLAKMGDRRMALIFPRSAVGTRPPPATSDRIHEREWVITPTLNGILHHAPEVSLVLSFNT